MNSTSVFFIITLTLVILVIAMAFIRVNSSHADLPLPLIEFAERLEMFDLSWEKEEGQMLAHGDGTKIILLAHPPDAPFDIEVTLKPVSKKKQIK